MLYFFLSHCIFALLFRRFPQFYLLVFIDFSFLSYFNFQRLFCVPRRFLFIKCSTLLLFQGCVTSLDVFFSMHILCSLQGHLSPCVCFNFYFPHWRLFSDVWNLSCLLTFKVGGPKRWLEWSLLTVGYMIDCGLRGTWFGWTVSSGIPVSVFTSLFSGQIPQTVLLSSLEGNSLAPFWEPSGPCWLAVCACSLHHHDFSMVWPDFELALYPVVQRLCFYSLQNINFQSFARLRMDRCLAVPLWGALVVCLRNNFHPILFIWDPLPFTATPRDGRCLQFPRLLQVLSVESSVGFSQVYQIGCHLFVCFPASRFYSYTFFSKSSCPRACMP